MGRIRASPIACTARLSGWLVWRGLTLLALTAPCSCGPAAFGPAAVSPSASPEPTSASAAPRLAYRVGADAALERLNVSVCFGGPAPEALVPGLSAAADALVDAHDGSGAPLPVREGRIDLAGVGPDDCVRYRVDVDAALRGSRLSMRVGGDVLTSQGAWLWRPPSLPTSGATLRFELPPGVRAATPWPRSGDDLLLGPSAFERPAFMAFGRFTPQVILRQRARVEVVCLGPGWDVDDAGVERWMSTAIDGVSTVQGRFPVDRLLVLLIPGGGRGIGFGMVRRGGGHSVAFLVGRHSTPDEMLESWVTWHELSHLQLPALPQEEAWLYEGLATYYQEVLPARMGIHTARHAWGQIVDGLSRGARGGTGRSLTDEATNMGQTRAYQRVYWAGTAFALEADVALRARGSSLDAALAASAPRWRDDLSVFSGRDVCRAWDETVDEPTTCPLRLRFARGVDFPPTDALLERLGITGEGAAVPAPLDGIRDAITQPAAGVAPRTDADGAN